jgi:hypothetical protein
VRYYAARQIFWDTNGGQAYTLRTNYGDSEGIYLPASTRVRARHVWQCMNKSCQEDRVVVDLHNLGYQKQVSIAYTLDNWATVQNAPLTYQAGPTADGLERWGVSLYPLSTFTFALAYTVNGTTYWDNSFGLNHTYSNNAQESSLIGQ